MKKVNWISLLFLEGYREMPRGLIFGIFMAIAIGISFFELWLGSIGNMSPYAYSVIFLTFLLPLAFLTTRSTKKATPKPSVFDYIFSILVMASGLYFVTDMDNLLSRISGVDELSPLHLASALILVLAVLELTRRTLGFGFTSLLMLVIGYAFFGHMITGTFGHRRITAEHFLEEMVFTSNGIYGTAVQMTATYAFLFIMFGHFFQKVGAGQFIFDICASFMGRKVGGLGKVAVTSAGIFGSISGSPAADVATTGSVNIPMMKKRGYDPVFAGSVEAASASGGTILPPIMGSVAFLMAEFTGIPYAEICIAALLSAILYYMGIYWQVHFRSLKMNLLGMDNEDIPNFWLTFQKGFYYLVPVILLVWVMLSGFTPSLAACYGIASIFLLSFFRRSTWITWKKFTEICSEVVYHIVPLTVATAAAGVIEGVINMTGMAGKFTSLIFAVTGENILMALIVSALIVIMLGMSMPTTSIYVLAAALVAPALLQLGLDILPVHLFLVFYAALSSVTPPMGGAIFVAAGIANANPMAVGIQSSKLAFVGFITPFFFIYNPSLLLQGSFVKIAFGVIAAMIGTYALAAGYEGFIHNKLVFWQRGVLCIAGIAMIYPNYIFNIAALGCIVFIYFSNKSSRVINNEGMPAHL
ncbi:TRAP transporter fused permease subunit [Fictibacillus enclensis]|uniref:TRAP transporter permease n=1 Tax=Fictibacillus enclensis TaxID=1017270 RepID=UPI0025A01377|nr:TRAP transporter fused permease subunit [Fictibacillus enclensis]MDM5196694.1 TRAP transporter fused permease subunit [Fictibacillus enclensis]